MCVSMPSGEKPAMKQECSHQADCLKMIQTILDGEATPQELDRLQANLEYCEPCIRMFKVETEIKQLLTSRMQKKCCPQQLVSVIRERITAVV